MVAVLKRAPEPLNIAEILDETARSLDFDLMATDRVWQRWAISVGSGLPVEQWEETPKSRLPPLDDVTAVIVDQIWCRAPPRAKDLLTPWYKGTGGPGSICRKLKLEGEAQLFLEWRATLRWSRARFVDSGHRELVRMVTGRV